MRKILPILAAFSLLLSASVAQAGEYEKRHKKSHRDHGKNKHFQDHKPHHGKKYSERRHENRKHPVYHKPSHKYRSKHHYKSHRNQTKAGYLLGGMFLGAVANELFSPNRTVVKERVYTERHPNYSRNDQVFLKDGYGTCYSVETKRHGKVLSEVSNHYCSAY